MRYLGMRMSGRWTADRTKWIAANGNEGEHALAGESRARPRAELLADYDFVKSGQAQMVDARSFQEYGKARIDNATFISPENVLEEGRLKTGSGSQGYIRQIERQPDDGGYSDDIFGASVVWFALQIMGFDARVYRWQDWQEH